MFIIKKHYVKLGFLRRPQKIEDISKLFSFKFCDLLRIYEFYIGTCTYKVVVHKFTVPIGEKCAGIGLNGFIFKNINEN